MRVLTCTALTAVALFIAIQLMMHTPASPQDHARDEVVIRGLEQAYDSAWNAGDVRALVALFAEDAVIVNPRGESASGRAGIEQEMRHFLGGPARNSTHATVITRLQFLRDDVAIVDGEATLEGLVGPDGGTEPPLVHRFTDLLTREHGTWRIAQVRAYAFLPEHSKSGS